MSKQQTLPGLADGRASAALALAESLAPLSAETLAAAYASLFGARPERGAKAALLAAFAGRLVAETEEGPAAFLERLPPLLREALELGVFRSYVDIGELERRHGLKILGKRREYGYHEILHLEPAARLGVFGLIDPDTIRLLDPLRAFFAGIFPKPAGWTPAPSPEPAGARYAADGAIGDILPLALRALDARDRYAIARKGFRKREAKAFEAECGLAPFPVAAAYGLEAGELLARFLAAFAAPPGERMIDSHERLRRAVAAFFDADLPLDFAHENRGILFEYRGLLDHLSKKQGGAANYLGGYPPVRSTFRECLSFAASGEWYSATALFDAAELRRRPLFILPELSREGFLKLTGERLELGDRIYATKEWVTSFEPFGRLHRDLADLPLFRAYCYLFATLGLLEIAEEPAPLRLVRNGKPRVLSPYDGLSALRVTPLGAWILGHRPERPAREEKRGLILVDPDLLLLTMKGDSLERRVFLESIGARLGTERYKVTEASFIAGCDSPEKIEERIRRFHELVSGEPPALWKSFFALLRTKSRIFLEPEAALLFKLPADERIRRLFASDPELRSLAGRVEGGSIVVRQADFPRLAKALSARGFHCPEPRRK
ncbi:MAG: hypothetical protein JNG85_17070 [Spirochaetaceae bacterium]|nr:hypothetical protein [Spirochaetaceae bacterium]